MADLSKVKVLDTEYNLKDAEARTRLTTAEAELVRLEAAKQDVIDASNPLAAAYVSLEKPEGSKLTSTDVQDAVYELEAAIETGGTGSVVTVEQQGTAEEGYFATYVIKQGGEAVDGPKINIPKDYLVKSAELKTVTKDDEPYAGAKVGDKYIDFVVNVKEGATDESHIYLPVNELVDAYMADETSIHMENNTFSVKAVAMEKVTGLEDALALKADDADLQAEISRATAAEALKEDKSALKALAYKDSATGTVPGQTITGVTATGDLEGSAAITLSSTSTAATLTKGDFTPAGSITGEAISGGSINVTLKDATTATNAVIAASSTFTPAGTVTATESGDFQALKTATFTADESGVAIEGTVSAPAVNLTSSEADVAIGLTGGKVASIDTTKFSGGSLIGAAQASFTQGSKASFTQGSKASFTKGTAVGAAIEGVVASVGTGDDAETLILTAADTHDVIGHTEATFTANGDDTFVANGDDSFTANELGTFTPAAIADGFFSANELQTASMGKVNNVTAAALANAPVFTGAKYKVATTADTALKEVAFTATNDVSVPTQITYVKQEVDAKTFTPVVAELGFSGTKAENVLVTGVNYDKADASQTGAVAITGAELAVGTITVAAKDVTVE